MERPRRNFLSSDWDSGLCARKPLRQEVTGGSDGYRPSDGVLAIIELDVVYYGRFAKVNMGAPQIVGPAYFTTNLVLQFFGSQNSIPWLFQVNGQRLYSLQQKIGSGGGNINGTGMWSSTDGTTYTELDAAHDIPNALGTMFYDAPNNQAIVALVQDTAPPTQQTVFLKTFSTLTNTWGANFAAGGPLAVTVVQHVFKRPDGTILVIYDAGNGHAPAGQTRLQANVWNGAAWMGAFDAGAGSFATDGANLIVSTCCAIMDPATGNVHLAYTNGTHYYYQEILENNTLGSFHAFGALNLNFGAFGNIIIQGNNLIIGGFDITSTHNEFFIGTPLSAPVWTTVTPANMVYTVGHVANQPIVATNGTNVYALVTFFDPTFVYVGFQIWVSTDGGHTWTLAPNNGTEPFFYDFTPGQSPVAPNTDATFGITAPIFQAITTPTFGLTWYVLTGVHNTSLGTNSTYVINAQIISQPGTGIGLFPNPQPRKLPWIVGRPRKTDGKHLFLR